MGIKAVYFLYCFLYLYLFKRIKWIKLNLTELAMTNLLESEIHRYLFTRINILVSTFWPILLMTAFFKGQWQDVDSDSKDRLRNVVPYLFVVCVHSFILLIRFMF